jgi:hypothetical protein
MPLILSAFTIFAPMSLLPQDQFASQQVLVMRIRMLSLRPGMTEKETYETLHLWSRLPSGISIRGAMTNMTHWYQLDGRHKLIIHYQCDGPGSEMRLRRAVIK